VKNCFVSTYKGEWIAPATVLRNELGFEIVDLDGKKFPSISSKKILVRKELHNIRNILKHYKEINHSHIVICSNYVALFLLLLQKMHLLKVDTICWYGVYIHSPKMVNLVGNFIKILSTGEEKFKIVVFSKEEVNLYSKAWKISIDSFIYVPYGEWSISMKDSSECKDEGYFFSGGYSNRDYVSLIRLFVDCREKLVIAASKHNIDLVEYVAENEISSNITILFDVDVKKFNELLNKAHCVIFVMKHNTGASGQMVVLNAMKNKKLILSTYTDCLDEYVKDGKEAIVVDKLTMFELFSDYIEQIGMDGRQYQFLVEAAYKKYKDCFSYEAISDSLVKQISNIK
jgi:glycosyltransferase involved in cell wall biosynthesis